VFNAARNASTGRFIVDCGSIGLFSLPMLACSGPTTSKEAKKLPRMVFFR
jgi:hypothetical protein